MAKLHELVLRRSKNSRSSSEDSFYDLVSENAYNDDDYGYSRNDGSNDIGGYKNNYFSDEEEDNVGSSKRSKKDTSGNNKRRKTRRLSTPPLPENMIRSHDISEIFKKATKPKPKQDTKKEHDDLQAMISGLDNGVKKPKKQKKSASSFINSSNWVFDCDPFLVKKEDPSESLGPEKEPKSKATTHIKRSVPPVVVPEPVEVIDISESEDSIESLGPEKEPKPKATAPVKRSVSPAVVIPEPIEVIDISESDSEEAAPLTASANKKSAVVKMIPQKPILSSTPLLPPLSPEKPSTPPADPVFSSPTRRTVAPKLADPHTPAPVQDEFSDTPEWMNLNERLAFANLEESIPADQQITKLSPWDVLEHDGSLRFFWTDYYDFNGKLGLFGKVKNHSTGEFGSMFLVISNLERELFFLCNPGEDGEGMMARFEEVGELFHAHGIGDLKAKSVSKKYCFELPEIPQEADYLKVLYKYEARKVLPSELKSKTFSHVFGTNTSIFEQFVLSKNISGPCWLEIKSPDFTSIRDASWCNLEVCVDDPREISVFSEPSLPTPPLNIMSLSIRTVINKKDNGQEVASISTRVYSEMAHDTTANPAEIPSFVFTYVRPIEGVFPMGFERDMNERRNTHKGRSTVRTFHDESTMLVEFLKQVERFDPDVFIGHSLENFHFNILSHRMNDKKISGWSRLGRRRLATWPQGFGHGSYITAQRRIAAGRLLLDISNTYGQSLTTKCDSWTLTEMADLYLNDQTQTRLDLPLDASKCNLTKSSGGLYEYLMHNEADTYFSIAIALKTQMLALSKQLTNIAGNSWAQCLTGTRAERNEYILLHEFYREGYILPDKLPYGAGKKKAKPTQPGQPTQPLQTSQTQKQVNARPEDVQGHGVPIKPGEKMDKFKGGLIFEHERGLYDKIIIAMDFNSFYPSIIQEFNICFTTVDRRACNTKMAEGNEMSGYDEKILKFPGRSVPMGIFPRLVQSLVEKRRAIERNMKDPDATATQRAQWDIKQQALKLTVDSMYDCLGFERSRFYTQPLAVLTTSKGREILTATEALAEFNNLRVIHSDTDSVVINTNVDSYDEALKIGTELKAQVNQRYRLLEIDIDNIFRRTLLYTKKKSAAIGMPGPEDAGDSNLSLEVKSLDMKRREYCVLPKQTSRYALNQILGTESAEAAVENIYEHLLQLAAQVRENKIPIAQYIMRNRLGKNPGDYYPSGVTMPFAAVAPRLVANGEPVRTDDVISYIVAQEVEGESENAEDARTFSAQHPALRVGTPTEILDYAF